MVEGKRRRKVVVEDDEMGEIKKGPWKVEEDEVLINHVRKHGPRDWTSIRSKGLLRRTGKSCRLRWVNKLRPNLKTGVKFSAEEERTVIDLQAQFGNKWAKIATHLPGRTDNDVKNFWSSRQKRLARILQTSTPSTSKSPKHKNEHQTTNVVSPLEVPKLSSSTEKETVNETSKMVPFWNSVYPNSHIQEHTALPPDYTSSQKKPLPEQQPLLSFPQIPQLQPDFPLLLESQDFITRHGDPSFLDEFEHFSGSVLGNAQVPIVPSFLEPQGTCPNSKTAERQDAVDIESLVDEFPPLEIFDQIEPLPSPSEWS